MMLLRPFIYQPRGDNDNGDYQPVGPLWFMAVATFFVVIIGLVVTAFAADLSVPRKRSGYPDPRCNTAARYEAMREAYESRLPDPCNGARVWRP